MTYRFAYRKYSLPFRVPVRTAHGVWATREGLILRLETESGQARFGEAAPISWFGTETVEEAEAICRDLGDFVTHERIATLPARFGCLRFAFEAALAAEFDAAQSKHRYLPVAALLPAGRAALADIGTKADAGFRTFKWKVGVGDVADELALLDDVVSKLPSGGMLRLDANGAWDRRRAERWLERAADRPVEFVEQPIAADAKGAEDLLLGLANDYPTPIGLDESAINEIQVERWLGAGWPGVFVVKPALVGGVAHLLARLSAAKAAVVFSSAIETAVGARALLEHAFAFDGQPRALGVGVWPIFSDHRFDGPVAAPFVRVEDIQKIDTSAVWNALN